MARIKFRTARSKGVDAATDQQREAQEKAVTDKARKKAARDALRAIPRTILDVMPIREYHEGTRGQTSYFTRADDMVEDIVMINGHGLTNCDQSDWDVMVNSCTALYQTLMIDIKIIQLYSPVNTSSHQSFLWRVYNRTESTSMKQLILQEIERLQELDQTTSEERSFLVLFAENTQKLSEAKELLGRSVLEVQELTYKQKISLFHHLNNPLDKIEMYEIDEVNQNGGQESSLA